MAQAKTLQWLAGEPATGATRIGPNKVALTSRYGVVRVFRKRNGRTWIRFTNHDKGAPWKMTGLTAAGGALFAAFPPVYATVFSGFYLAMMLVLLGLIFRAVAIEFRNKVDRPGWTKAWDFAFSAGSILPSLLYGVAIGNVLKGLELNEIGDYTGGFFALLNPFALVCGLVGLSMFALHGALYIAMKLDGEVAAAARGWANKAWYVFLLLFMVAVGYGIKNCVHGIKAVPMALVLLALVSNSLVFMLNKKEKAAAAFVASGASSLSLECLSSDRVTRKSKHDCTVSVDGAACTL